MFIRNKIVIGLICASLCLSFTACSGTDKTDNVNASDNTEEQNVSDSAGEQESSANAEDQDSSENHGVSEGYNDDGSYTASFFAMDTKLKITAYGDDAKEAVDAGVEEVYRIENLLSITKESSIVNKINKAGSGQLDEESAYIIEKAYDTYEKTDGAFDITIYPVKEAWGFVNEEYKVPTDKELSDALKLVGMDRLDFDADKLSISLDQGQAIDLGGIAKGYASDSLRKLFEKYDVDSAVLDLGGNIVAIGTKEDGSKWRVGIREPDSSGQVFCAVGVEDKCVITSGGYERYFEEDGVTYHHIIDPATGYPANNGLVSVSIVSEDGTVADSLSTALYVLGTDKAIEYCKEHCKDDGFDAIFMTEDGDVYVTSGIEDDFVYGYDFNVIDV